MAYRRQYGLNVRIQRPFNVYGPRIREDGIYGRVIPRFISQGLKNEDITIHGDGMQTRSFLYVDDWVSGTLKFLFTENVEHAVMNIGSDSEITIRELAKLVLKQTESRSRIVNISAREDDPRRRSADLSIIKKELGWFPATELNIGLKKTIEWFRVNAK